MSRVPRSQEHLKTAFTVEATAAARFRAYARRAERDGQPRLAARWLELAAAKDELAIRLLAAAGRAGEPEVSIRDALAEERYENQVLYPRMIDEVDAAAAATLTAVAAEQAGHVDELDGLRRAVQASTGDLAVDRASAAAE